MDDGGRPWLMNYYYLVQHFVVCYLGDRYTYIPRYSIAVYCLQRTNHKNARAYTLGVLLIESHLNSEQISLSQDNLQRAAI